MGTFEGEFDRIMAGEIEKVMNHQIAALATGNYSLGEEEKKENTDDSYCKECEGMCSDVNGHWAPEPEGLFEEAQISISEIPASMTHTDIQSCHVSHDTKPQKKMKKSTFKASTWTLAAVEPKSITRIKRKRGEEEKSRNRTKVVNLTNLDPKSKSEVENWIKKQKNAAQISGMKGITPTPTSTQSVKTFLGLKDNIKMLKEAITPMAPTNIVYSKISKTQGSRVWPRSGALNTFILDGEYESSVLSFVLNLCETADSYFDNLPGILDGNSSGCELKANFPCHEMETEHVKAVDEEVLKPPRSLKETTDTLGGLTKSEVCNLPKPTDLFEEAVNSFTGLKRSEAETESKEEGSVGSLFLYIDRENVYSRSDVEVVANEEGSGSSDYKTKCHASFLMANSEVFRTMLYNNLKEQNTNKIVLNMHPEVAEKFIYMMYVLCNPSTIERKDHMPSKLAALIPVEISDRLYDAAIFYRVFALSAGCLRSISSFLESKVKYNEESPSLRTNYIDYSDVGVITAMEQACYIIRTHWTKEGPSDPNAMKWLEQFVMWITKFICRTTIDTELPSVHFCARNCAILSCLLDHRLFIVMTGVMVAKEKYITSTTDSYLLRCRSVSFSQHRLLFMLTRFLLSFCHTGESSTMVDHSKRDFAREADEVFDLLENTIPHKITPEITFMVHTLSSYFCAVTDTGSAGHTNIKISDEQRCMALKVARLLINHPMREKRPPKFKG